MAKVIQCCSDCGFCLNGNFTQCPHCGAVFVPDISDVYKPDMQQMLAQQMIDEINAEWNRAV